MRWIVCICLTLCAIGCGTDWKDFADRHVEKDMLSKNDKREAIPFLEQHGEFYGMETPADESDASDESADAPAENVNVDQEIVLPLLKQLKQVAPTEQWAMIRPEKKNSAYGILVALPDNPHLVDQMAAAVQEADDKFSGFILQQWGHEWLLIDLIDKQSYEYLKMNDPDIDKQR